jgi:DNA-directed RNA polymerase specialized sigma24 family protein
VEEVVDPSAAVAPTFDDVYAGTWPQVVRTAFLIVGSRAVAEEIGQEAFLRLYRNFADVRNPGGFLRTTAVRLCLTWRDRTSAEAARWRAVTDPGPVGDPGLDGIWDALARLRPDRRVALVLRFYEDLPYEEIAAVTGCRVSTARTRVHRGLADLRRELEQ